MRVLAFLADARWKACLEIRLAHGFFKCSQRGSGFRSGFTGFTVRGGVQGWRDCIVNTLRP